MNAKLDSLDLILKPEDNVRLANLCGQFDQHLRQIEQRMGIQINNKGHRFKLTGPTVDIGSARELLKTLYRISEDETITPANIHLHLHNTGQASSMPNASGDSVAIRSRRGSIEVRGEHQLEYVRAIQTSDLTFGIGPAGTGKTYLAVACGVEALEQERVRRLVLVRPAVEAGEHLGFLPGDLAQKIDPYLRPMYDALYEMLGFERVARLVEKNVIEIAPLAYMRGRTLNDAFIILDEAQNTTVEQMKMFLTRIGFGSTAVVTGDITQIDLPISRMSGLKQAIEILRDEKQVSFVFFNSKDVVRHPLVQRIVDAYERFEEQKKPNKKSKNE
ncbi:MAG: PhoH family protein [Gammaproteobacteria bacterium]|nr:PhoH family protein [Gammaproteobacteria bacterium]